MNEENRELRDAMFGVELAAQQDWNKTVHAVGMRDALAGLFAAIRAKGERAALKEAAAAVVATDPAHPHASWYLSNNP